jgi:hypothetical protein
MRSRAILFCSLALLALAAIAHSSRLNEAADQSPILGVWRAEMDGLPFVTLTLTNENGGLSGAVLFYLHRRDHGKPVTSTPGVPEPLLNPSFDGKTLTFKVSHRRAHPPRSLSDSPVEFRLRLTGGNKAALVNASESASEFVLTRTDY